MKSCYRAQNSWRGRGGTGEGISFRRARNGQWGLQSERYFLTRILSMYLCAYTYVFKQRHCRSLLFKARFVDAGCHVMAVSCKLSVIVVVCCYWLLIVVCVGWSRVAIGRCRCQLGIKIFIVVAQLYIYWTVMNLQYSIYRTVLELRHMIFVLFFCITD